MELLGNVRKDYCLCSLMYILQKRITAWWAKKEIVVLLDRVDKRMEVFM